MSDFLMVAAALVLLSAGVGLLRVLWGPTVADRLMAVQLLGTSGAAVLVLIAAAAGNDAGVVDVALILALLAAPTAVAFVQSTRRSGND